MAGKTINGTQLEYFDDGSGEPLVIVHGSASDYRTWRYQRDEFAQQFRVITYSRRHHWPNEPIGEGIDYSMSRHVDDLQALIQSVDGSAAHLVGHSYGAIISLRLAMREPSLVRTMVLAEPPVITMFVSNNPKPLELLRLLITRPRIAASASSLNHCSFHRRFLFSHRTTDTNK